jgi:SAM-dependent methyltransferase
VHLVELYENTKKLYWVTGPFFYASVILPRNARVLEVGAGQDPHPAADVIVEKYMDDNRHRMMGADPVFKSELVQRLPDGTETTVPYNPGVVQADVVDLPFADKAFDFVICKDILEHVPDVERAFREISRVGRAGFIDVPRLTSEFLWPQPDIHVWTFSMDGDCFVAHRIDFVSPFGKVMHEAFDKNIDMQVAWANSRQYFHVVRFWRDEVRVRIGEPITDTVLYGG